MSSKLGRTVVVTGWGAVSAYGWGVQHLANVFSGKAPAPYYGINANGTAKVLKSASDSKALSQLMLKEGTSYIKRRANMSIFATSQAMHMARLNSSEVGLLGWGSGLNATGVSVDAYQSMILQQHNLPRDKSAPSVPISWDDVSTTGIAAWAGLDCPVMTYLNTCASSAVAIGEAMFAISQGRCSSAIVGGSESFIESSVFSTPSSNAEALHREHTHHSSDIQFTAAKKCSSMVLGEGAACMILESESHALKRGAHILAYCLGYAQVSDPDCMRKSRAEPKLRTMYSALQQAGVSTNDVSYVNAHSFIEQNRNSSEIDALNSLFGDTHTLVSSTKGATGHLMGASGAIEAIIAINALRFKKCPPNFAVRKLDPRIRFNAPLKPTALRSGDVCLSNSFSVGGTNVSLVFKAHY
ncbi:beta-ketoacyl synthase N-terminal-like domain-containing protein [Rhodoferax mekongensis]|uniref:beta-ketoacyl synthase N-terminal-like domain-containing protein n=1 Tax=Rhodoferax mekongensis TaxID=3068341 RepID=UPI0028BD2BA9|nr:beta-ketoacyl synthase N-terminal-like domain-containing protein [Rhodoferax sp. TBRC 17199]MDT7517105.1 beta-ketoacyl synthase N-terminal-like domain-containing protein [Rhodoferax sp. TBRC 17199]